MAPPAALPAAPLSAHAYQARLSLQALAAGGFDDRHLIAQALEQVEHCLAHALALEADAQRLELAQRLGLELAL